MAKQKITNPFFHRFPLFQTVFNVAEAILRSVGQNSRLAISRTQAGWLMIGALMTMGE